MAEEEKKGAARRRARTGKTGEKPRVRVQATSRPTPPGRSAARSAQLARQTEMAREGRMAATRAGGEGSMVRRTAGEAVGAREKAVRAGAGRLAGRVAGKAAGLVGAVLGASAVSKSADRVPNVRGGVKTSGGPSTRGKAGPKPASRSAGGARPEGPASGMPAAKVKSAPPAARPERSSGGQSSTRTAFNEAFRQARASGASEFTFRGKKYNTKLA